MFVFVLLSVTMLVRAADDNFINNNNGAQPGDQPLFLSPLIAEQRLEEARKQSRVDNLTSFGVEAFSGYITVDEGKGSNLFFFLVKSEQATKDRPLILWLQGGPGQSSLFTAFTGTGPIGINKDGELSKRALHLQTDYDILYLDEPVGAGYSFTKDAAKGFPKSIEDMAVAMEVFLRQFLLLFSEYNGREFYISGESYGVRPAAALAAHVYDLEEQGNPLCLNLSGVMLGVGFFRELYEQKDVSDYYLQLGLVDLRDYVELKQRVDQFKGLMKNSTALLPLLALFADTFRTANNFTNPTFFNKITSFIYDSNALQATPPPEFHQFNELMRSDWFKKSVHVGTAARFRDSDHLIRMNLATDLFKNISKQLEFLLKMHCRVVVYCGQVDLTFPIVKTQEFLLNLEWPEADEFRGAPRLPWWGDAADDDFAGHVTEGGGLRFVTLRFTGHYPFFDQPKDAYEVVRAFVANRTLLTKKIDVRMGRYVIPEGRADIHVSNVRPRNPRSLGPLFGEAPGSTHLVDL